MLIANAPKNINEVIQLSPLTMRPTDHETMRPTAHSDRNFSILSLLRFFLWIVFTSIVELQQYVYEEIPFNFTLSLYQRCLLNSLACDDKCIDMSACRLKATSEQVIVNRPISIYIGAKKGHYGIEDALLAVQGMSKNP